MHPGYLWQAVDVRALVREMHGVLQDYCFCFWGKLGALQYARGLLATPFPLCSMSIGVHLSAPPTPVRSIWWPC